MQTFTLSQVALALGALALFFGFSTQNFFSAETFRNIANQSPAITIVAVGMTFVLMIGGIDLSVGSLLGLCAILFGQLWHDAGLSVPVAIVLTLVFGALGGALNAASVWQLAQSASRCRSSTSPSGPKRRRRSA